MLNTKVDTLNLYTKNMYMYGGMCGGSCGYEPITREERLAVLEQMEKGLEKKLENIRKAREELKSEKTEKVAAAA